MLVSARGLLRVEMEEYLEWFAECSEEDAKEERLLLLSVNLWIGDIGIAEVNGMTVVVSSSPR